MFPFFGIHTLAVQLLKPLFFSNDLAQKWYKYLSTFLYKNRFLFPCSVFDKQNLCGISHWRVSCDALVPGRSWTSFPCYYAHAISCEQKEVGLTYARQGMRACNNINMNNPSLHYGVRMLLLHVIIPCLADILPLFLWFWHCHPYYYLYAHKLHIHVWHCHPVIELYRRITFRPDVMEEVYTHINGEVYTHINGKCIPTIKQERETTSKENSTCLLLYPL